MGIGSVGGFLIVDTPAVLLHNRNTLDNQHQFTNLPSWESLTKTGREFMYDYDARGSLAPRDIVARSIEAEMKKWGEPHVFLDITHQSKEHILEHFPTIFEKCLSLGIDISKEQIPVTPAAHYLCGGIWVDEHGRSTIQRMYACGECSSTGLHGANRLASNSLLEAAVFGHRIAEDALQRLDSIHFHKIS